MAGQPKQGVAQEKASGAEGSFSIKAPTVSLPKGGGAIRGMGEKFAANPVTGTGSMTVPIATSPGRSGFGPQLSLSYDSGAGNGPFGFGWSLSLPAITRKTDKGLPTYRDAEESDVFILSGAEDLVPEFEKDATGNWVLKDGRHVIHDKPRTVDGVTYNVRRYRPRIEGLFARIERWTKQGKPEDTFWRSISKDNITTWYGKTGNSRIVDPVAPSHIFSWLICQSYDDKGNVILYRYKEEDSENLDLSQANERNRTPDTRKANRYLKRITYGNREPYMPVLTETGWPQPPDQNPGGGPPNYYFEVVFDYEDGHYTEAAPDAEGRIFAEAVYDPPASAKWARRADPFSSYRSGFEVRTYRLCQRVLMFHHFPNELGVPDYLVRSTDFTYSYEENPSDARNPIYSFLLSVTQSGYKRQGNGYLKKSLPPVQFEYTQPIVQDTVETIDAESLDNLPVGLDGTAYQWTDLHGEGIPGILTEQGGAWFYKRNLSPINEQPRNGRSQVEAKFAPVELVAVKPTLALAAGAQFMDLAGDGQPDLVVMDSPIPGLYEHDEAEGWQPFRPFTARLHRDMRDSNLKFVDIDGDGHADILITEDTALVWHASEGEAGFGPARRVAQALDEEKGPRLVFADGTQSIYLADLSGDGLTDLVRIRNREVCYWPNLGYGRFGAKVTMDHAPRFDSTDQFDQKRIRLADIDGSGTTDIMYLHRKGVRLYFNQSGNSWSEPRHLNVFPRVDDHLSIVPTDLLGNGTACLVWSSPLPGDARRPMRYVNLMGGQKPHLLVKTVNNLGAETQVQYAPSTKFYLQDKQAGKPWITRLPFPVHVVERVEIYDHISRNRFVTRYKYHHGYFDGEEREFRGFGMVEQWDTEEFASLSRSVAFPAGDNIDAASHVPAVLTKTWFHTGVYLGRDRVSRFFAGLLDENDIGEYYREPGLTDDQARQLLLPDTVLPSELSLDEEREACRALKGSMLRQEIYALDGTDKQQHPYTVTEQNFTIKRLQPHDGNRHGVFFTHAREAINYHYERSPEDPRTQHALTLEVDDFGNVLKSAAIAYGRRMDAPDATLLPQDRRNQRLIHITSTESLFTNAVTSLVDGYRTPLPAETRTYEVRKPEQEKSGNGLTALYGFDTVLGSIIQAGDGTHEVDYEDFGFVRAQKAAAQDPTERDKYFRRLIEQVRTLYRPNDCGVAQNNPLALLPLRTLEPLALPGESYKLAFSTGLAKLMYVDSNKVSQTELDGLLASDVKYVHSQGDDHWWIPSGRVFYASGSNDSPMAELAEARQHFFLPRRYRDPFGHDAFVDFDANDLLMTETRDALGNRVTVNVNDYRVLQPRLVSDPNRNRTEVAFDTLGMVVGTAVMGKPEENLGDSLDGFEADLAESVILTHLSDPLTDPHAILGRATTRLVYDLFAYRRTKEDEQPQPAVVYTLAGETHHVDLAPNAKTKVQSSFSYSDGFGREIQKKIQAEPGPLVQNGVQVNPRWVGSGWTIFNNKGKPVRQYEPFFSKRERPDGALYSDHRFEFGVKVGVSPVLFYDPAERVIATLHPNHTYEKVRFDPWRQVTYDVNDTVAAHGAETGDPRTDLDIKGYVEKYFESMGAAAGDWQTWYAQRIGGALGPHERDAAVKAAAHADTPTVAHFDSLGRPFVTLAHNRFERNGATVDEKYPTRVELDIEGNQRAVRDAVKHTEARDAAGNPVIVDDPLGRIVMRYDYDMLGNRIHQLSMEAGARWMLNDVAGKPIRAWDSRGFMRRMTYDELRRPTGLYVTEGASERLAERTLYGEGQGDAANHRTRVHQMFDGVGIVTSLAYDFKGNLLESRRELLPTYKQAVDWNQNPAANDGTFTNMTTYDALNRPLTVTTPDRSVYRPTFNEANLLDKVDVNLRGAAAATAFVANINYNAKGQRELIVYGNRAETTYTYDALTFRLTHLKTTRPAGLNGPASQLFENPAIAQDLHYTYDPAGNITRIEDAALKTVYYNNEQVQPVCTYVYDAIYRLIEAAGREHIDQSKFQFVPPDCNYRDYPFVGHGHANDLQALRKYTERYEYDEVGNFKHFIHQVTNDRWMRAYEYNETSLIEDGMEASARKTSNRLSRTILQPGSTQPLSEPYSYDAHGSMTTMPHLPLMQWDFKDQLSATSKQVTNTCPRETTYYVYDAAGQRVRKVTERENGTRKDERIYLGGFEVYREYGPSTGSGQAVELERETLHVMDDKQRIALVETKTLDAQHPAPSTQHLIRYQFGNHLGSASVELDKDGALISYEEYHPYGTTAFQTGSSAAEVSRKRYRYTGMERDEESGFGHQGLRYYSAVIARWLSTDPIGIDGGLNLYQYAMSSPIAVTDRSGKQPRKYSVDFSDPTIIIGRRYSSSSQLHLQAAKLQHEANAVPTGGSEDQSVKEGLETTATGYRTMAKENIESTLTLIRQETNQRQRDSWKIIEWTLTPLKFTPAGIPFLVRDTLESSYAATSAVMGEQTSVAPGSFLQTKKLSGADRVFTFFHGLADVAFGLIGARVNVGRSNSSSWPQTEQLAKKALKPLFEWVAKLPRIQAIGRQISAVDRLLRFFVAQTNAYPNLRDTPVGRWLIRIFGQRAFEQGHIFFQQSWIRNWYAPGSAAARGLQRLANAGFNLFPLPRAVNQAVGQDALTTVALAYLIPEKFAELMAYITGAKELSLEQ